MSDQLIELISKQTNSSNVVFNITKRMLKNSEMNATAPIREFLNNESIFDFDKMPDAHKVYMECAILHNSESIVAKIRFGFPPIKREARFWVYGLNNFTKPDENILMTKLEDKLVVIPLNQEDEHLTNIKEVLRSTVLNSKFKKELKRRKRNKKFKAFKKNHIEQALFNTRLGLEG
ncbi:hypothetical protein [Tenacibaculum agarivorans]|uniref:hypothetical protein n=1 Tax=Tenacibaculum agarivorans TaxID=1908389 RepID=UPI00094BB693|nr:hypothetical protein [Tenacibaculum agarivorans]